MNTGRCSCGVPERSVFSTVLFAANSCRPDGGDGMVLEVGVFCYDVFCEWSKGFSGCVERI